MKKFCLYLLASLVAFNAANAQTTACTDSLLKKLNLQEKDQRENALIKCFTSYLQTAPQSSLSALVAEMDNFLVKNNVDNTLALEYYIESVHQARLSRRAESETALVNALKAVDKNDDFLIYTFFNNLAAKQTEAGNVIAAVSSYGNAKKEAIKLNNTNLQLMVDINISDAYYKNNFYNQSLFYLDQAQGIIDKYWPDDGRTENVISYNKCENFFRMNNLDSLAFYNEKIRKSTANTYKLYTYKNRTNYYISLLRHDYTGAINLIRAMQNDGGYKFEDEDLENLADAFYDGGQLDSAKSVINALLSKPSEANHPETKYHLYAVLGGIAEQQGDFKSATTNLKLSQQESKDIMDRLSLVDNISSQIKLDEVEGYYTQESENYQRQRLWLIFITIVTLLALTVIAMVARNIKQKRHYEKLLYDTKREELAFLNSHDVRKYLTNILGLIEVIRQGKDKAQEFLQVEDFLFESAQQLDTAIKNFSEKLDD